MYTDAYALKYGAILTQLDDNDIECVICFASRATQGSESKYDATKLEAKAVVWAVELFNCYLHSTHFTLVTDHKALVELFKKGVN